MINDSKILEAIDLRKKGLTWKEVSIKIFGRDSVRETIRKKVIKYCDDNKTEIIKYEKELIVPKIWICDIETAPTNALLFNWYDAYTTADKVIEMPYIMNVAGKMLSDTEVQSWKLPDFETFKTNHRDDSEMMKVLWKIVDSCDVFVAHNLKFDKGWILQELLKAGLPPPSPFKFIDTFKVVKALFHLPSNKLDSIAAYFPEIEFRKLVTNFELWKRCWDGDIEAFAEMDAYNKVDVIVLEKIYLMLRPWMTNHPNMSLITKNPDSCPVCGHVGIKIPIEKHYITSSSAFKQSRCENCGTIMRDAKAIKDIKSNYRCI